MKKIAIPSDLKENLPSIFRLANAVLKDDEAKREKAAAKKALKLAAP